MPSHPDMDSWSGDEPDPYREDLGTRCGYCGAEPNEECTPWCREDTDVVERDDE